MNQSSYEVIDQKINEQYKTELEDYILNRVAIAIFFVLSILVVFASVLAFHSLKWYEEMKQQIEIFLTFFYIMFIFYLISIISYILSFLQEWYIFRNFITENRIPHEQLHNDHVNFYKDLLVYLSSFSLIIPIPLIAMKIVIDKTLFTIITINHIISGLIFYSIAIGIIILFFRFMLKEENSKHEKHLKGINKNDQTS